MIANASHPPCKYVMGMNVDDVHKLRNDNRLCLSRLGCEQYHHMKCNNWGHDNVEQRWGSI